MPIFKFSSSYFMGISKPKDEYAEKLKAERKTRLKKPELKAEVPRLKEVIRLVGYDLDGSKPVLWAIKKIRGISHTMAKVVCVLTGIDPSVRLGALSEEQLKHLEAVMNDPIGHGAPVWLVNRQKDLQTGQHKHLMGVELEVQQRFDVQRYINLRTYRGIRHMHGLPVRGQHTRSTFRKGKTVGVIKKEVKIRMAKAESKE